MPAGSTTTPAFYLSWAAGILDDERTTPGNAYVCAGVTTCSVEHFSPAGYYRCQPVACTCLPHTPPLPFDSFYSILRSFRFGLYFLLPYLPPIPKFISCDHFYTGPLYHPFLPPCLTPFCCCPTTGRLAVLRWDWLLHLGPATQFIHSVEHAFYFNLHLVLPYHHRDIDVAHLPTFLEKEKAACCCWDVCCGG